MRKKLTVGGSISRDGAALAAGTQVVTPDLQWRSEDGSITYTRTNGTDLSVAFGGDNPDDSLLIKNFDFTAAQGLGAHSEAQAALQSGAKSFGIRLAPETRLALAATDDRSINLARLPADQVQAATTLAENRTRSLTVFASAAADHARTVKLSASDGSHLSVGIGAEFLDLGAGDVGLAGEDGDDVLVGGTGNNIQNGASARNAANGQAWRMAA